MTAPKLETFIRQVKQPQGGFIPLSDLSVREFGGEALASSTGFSPMLLSSIVQQIVAFGACGRDEVIKPMFTNIHARIKELPDHIQDQECDLIYDDVMCLKGAAVVDASFIRSLCRLYTYAPQTHGGQRRYPDGGYTDPISADVKLIWQLARRAYAFISEDEPEWVEFKKEYDVDAGTFSTATVDFLTPYAAYKISPSSSAPPTRDILLTFVWAALAKVDRFGVFNPMLDTLWWGRVSDLDVTQRKAILSNFLND